MSVAATENFTTKVIVRFRHKAGKNGQLFPLTSWNSGFLITSSQRLILAAGPFHHLIPLDTILSIEDDGILSRVDRSRKKVIPISFSSGPDAYLTLVGVTPTMRSDLIKELYQAILSSYRGFYLEKDGAHLPITFKVEPDSLLLVTGPSLHVEVKKEELQTIKMNKGRDGSLITIVRLEGLNTLRIIARNKGGEWIRKLIEHYKNDVGPTLDKRYKEVMHHLENTPTTTGTLSEDLNLAALEASTILNEMIFLGWVTMDHDSKLYTLTGRGVSLLRSG